MSRIGKMPINISDVEVKIEDKSSVIVSGKLGELRYDNLSSVNIGIKDKLLSVSPANDSSKSLAMWGTARSIINNMVIGVTVGYTTIVQINGVGYKSSVKGNILTLALGFSHDIKYMIPKDIKIEVEKNTFITVFGIDKQKVGQVVSVLMSLRPFEPYKGKGVFIKGKEGRRKDGKKK
ncbi:MAG: 50S ribosomal protein L6 [Pseudomonadota bacterium]